MASMQLKMRVAESPHLTSVLGEIEQLMEGLDAELFASFEKVFDAVVELPDFGDELFAVERDRLPARTDECVVLFKPGKTLLCLLAALRARNPDLFRLVDCHEKDLLLVGGADSQPHHISQQEAPITDSDNFPEIPGNGKQGRGE